MTAKARPPASRREVELLNKRGPCPGRVGNRDCRRYAGWGTEHPGFGYCADHEKDSPEHKKAAGWEAAREAAAWYGDIEEITPEDALLLEIRRCAGIVRWMEIQIGKFGLDSSNLDPEVMGGSPDLRAPMLVEIQDRGSAPTNLHEWLRVYREERIHLVRVAKMTLDAGIEERKVKLAEQQGEMMVKVIRAVLDQMGLTDAQRELIPTVVPAVIRQLVPAAS